MKLDLLFDPPQSANDCVKDLKMTKTVTESSIARNVTGNHFISKFRSNRWQLNNEWQICDIEKGQSEMTTNNTIQTLNQMY